ETRLNAELLRLSRELDMELVVTNGSYYTRQSDAQMHDILLCLQMGKVVTDPSRFRFSGPEYYIKNGDELMGAFPEIDSDIIAKGIENTLLIADKCNLELELDKSILPDYPVPEGMTPESYLKELVFQKA